MDHRILPFKLLLAAVARVIRPQYLQAKAIMAHRLRLVRNCLTEGAAVEQVQPVVVLMVVTVLLQHFLGLALLMLAAAVVFQVVLAVPAVAELHLAAMVTLHFLVVAVALADPAVKALKV
jgi:hypothetical protein